MPRRAGCRWPARRRTRAWPADAGEEDLRGFAGHHAERRQIADRVASDEGAERLADGKAPVRRHAQPPGARANEETRAGEAQDGQETPADLTDAVEDLGDARAADGVAEQHQAAQRRQNGHDVAAVHHVMRQLGRRASICLNVSSMRRSLSSFVTLRSSSFEAMAIEMSTASLRICCSARAVSISI